MDSYSSFTTQLKRHSLHNTFSAPPELTTHFIPSSITVPWSHPCYYGWLLYPFKILPSPAQSSGCTQELPCTVEVPTFISWINWLICTSFLSLGINLPALTHPQLPAHFSPSLWHTIYLLCQFYFACHLPELSPPLTENPFHHDPGELSTQTALTGRGWFPNLVLENSYLFDSALFFGFTQATS